jgi:hypothetical protein
MCPGINCTVSSRLYHQIDASNTKKWLVPHAVAFIAIKGPVAPSKNWLLFLQAVFTTVRHENYFFQCTAANFCSRKGLLSYYLHIYDVIAIGTFKMVIAYYLWGGRAKDSVYTGVVSGIIYYQSNIIITRRCT